LAQGLFTLKKRLAVQICAGLLRVLQQKNLSELAVKLAVASGLQLEAFTLFE
jgi:hypothetical protein